MKSPLGTQLRVIPEHNLNYIHELILLVIVFRIWAMLVNIYLSFAMFYPFRFIIANFSTTLCYYSMCLITVWTYFWMC